MAIGRIPQRLRKSFDLPALVAIARAKLSSLEFIVQPRPVAPITPLYSFTRTTCPLGSCRLPHACRPLVRSLLLSPARRASLERFGRSSPLPVLLQVSVRQSLESVAYAHTAADLHVRPVSRTALVRDRGRREQLTNTPWGADGNEIDSRILPATMARRAPQQGRCLPRKSNALIHCADSSRAATVTFSSKWKIKVTSPSWKSAALSIFPNGALRIAIKSRESRIFFCAPRQGNSRTRLRPKHRLLFHIMGMPQRLLAGVCEVSGAAKMHRERCTGRTTEVSESVTLLSRGAQDIGKKKSPASNPLAGLDDEFQFRSGRAQLDFDFRTTSQALRSDG
jgi:hypothetical protein